MLIELVILCTIYNNMLCWNKKRVKTWRWSWYSLVIIIVNRIYVCLSEYYNMSNCIVYELWKYVSSSQLIIMKVLNYNNFHVQIWLIITTCHVKRLTLSIKHIIGKCLLWSKTKYFTKYSTYIFISIDVCRAT